MWLFLMGLGGTSRDECVPVCLDNNPCPFPCICLLEQPFSWLFLLCDPMRLYTLWYKLTHEVQVMASGTGFLEENCKLTVFAEGQAPLLSCQCLKLV